jgi:hypothetical protein
MEQAGSAAADRQGGQDSNQADMGAARWRWLKVLALILLALGGLALVANFVRGKDWAAAEHARNYRELTRVTNAIERWPLALDRMAQSQLVAGRLEPPPDSRLREHGWHTSVETPHPDLGPIVINYRFDDSTFTKCVDDTTLRASLVQEAGALNVLGEVSLRAIWYDDLAYLRPASEITAPTAESIEAIFRTLGEGHFRDSSGQWIDRRGVLETMRGDEPDARCPVLSWRVMLPFAKMADLPTNGPGLSSVLLLNRAGKVIATAGVAVPPINSVDQLILQDDEVWSTLQGLVEAASKSTTSSESREAAARKDAISRWLSGSPLEVTAGGERYVSYIRPLKYAARDNLDLESPDCRVKQVSTTIEREETVEIVEVAEANKKTVKIVEKGPSRAGMDLEELDARNQSGTAQGGSAASSGASKPPAEGGQPNSATAGVDATPILGEQCAVVALVRQQELDARAFSFQSALFTGLALLLALAIVLVPVLKLRYLGPAGSLRPAEVVAATFGLVAATALVTLAAILLVQSAFAHGRERRALKESARAVAEDVRDELHRVLRQPVWTPRLDLPIGIHPDIAPQPYEAQCPVFSFGTDGSHLWRMEEGSRAPVAREMIALPKDPGTKGKPVEAWPLRTAMGLYGSMGVAWPMTRVAAFRCHTGARVNIGARGYFTRALAEDFDARLPSSAGNSDEAQGKAARPPRPCSALGEKVRLSRNYTIEANRSLSDGLPTVIVALKARTESEPEFASGDLDLCPVSHEPGAQKVAPLPPADMKPLAAEDLATALEAAIFSYERLEGESRTVGKLREALRTELLAGMGQSAPAAAGMVVSKAIDAQPLPDVIAGPLLDAALERVRALGPEQWTPGQVLHAMDSAILEAFTPVAREGLLQSGREGEEVESVLRGPRTGVAIQVMILRSLLAPVLAPGQSFVVVDARSGELPYLFGSHPGRIGADQIGPALADGGAREAIQRAAARQRAIVHWWKEAPANPIPFTQRYEGEDQHFIAQGLPGTPWVLLVHAPVESVDRRIARAASDAAFTWVGISLLVLIGLIAWSRGRLLEQWLWLWPRPGMAQKVNSLASPIFRLSLGGIALILLLLFLQLHLLVQLTALVAFLAVPILSLGMAWHVLRPVREGPANELVPASDRKRAAERLALLIDRLISRFLANPPDESGAVGRDGPQADMVAPRSREVLRPRDEKAYRRLYLALSLALGATTITALWVDAAVDGRLRAKAETRQHYSLAYRANRQALSEQRDTLGVTYTEALGQPQPGDLPWAGLHRGVLGVAGNASPMAARLQSGLGMSVIELVRRARDEQPAPAIPFCGPVSETDRGRGGTEWCLVTRPDDGPADIRLAPGMLPLIGSPSLVAAGFTLITLLLLWLLLRASRSSFERGLFGFGVPVEAVEFPGIKRKDCKEQKEGKLDLPDRAVILNGPHALEIDLLNGGKPLDLGEKKPGASNASTASLTEAAAEEALKDGQSVVVVGLDLALKSPALRIVGLAVLERLNAIVEQQLATRGKGSGHKQGRIVILTDLSPLDRILQAYERQQGPRGRDPLPEDEQIRWSRLLEDFSTISLLPSRKLQLTPDVEWTARAYLEERGHPEGEIAGILAICRELQWLPEEVIDPLLPAGDRPDWTATRCNYPVNEDVYHAAYAGPIFRWAQHVRPASEAAAVDFLRGILIEHYQHVWAASSHAERLILDALARGRMVNMEAALAMRSLVRRGLVVLDPEPRLMNQSFAAFVRQAERPDTIERYREEFGSSTWEKAARPLALILPAAVVGLLALAMVAGESIGSLLPVVLSAGPALVGAATGLFRQRG